MTRASAPRYDRFKTVVAVILGIILLLMLLRGCATDVVPSAPAEIPSGAPATVMPPTAAPATETETETAPVANTIESLTSTAVPPTAEATETPATTSSPAATEAPTSTPEQATATPVQDTSCNTIASTRLSVGQKARVMQRLNMRSAASIKASMITVNPANTQVEIIGGPTCEPVGAHAYRWWQIRLADGAEGWSAESPLNSGNYFLEPLP